MNGETIGKARGGWRRFKEGKPGQRFENLYRWRKENIGGGLWRLLPLVLGTALVLAGILLMVIPGPGLLLFFFGLGVIGTESLLVARFMDWSEARGRGLVRRIWGIRTGRGRR